MEGINSLLKSGLRDEDHFGMTDLDDAFEVGSSPLIKPTAASPLRSNLSVTSSPVEDYVKRPQGMQSARPCLTSGWFTIERLNLQVPEDLVKLIGAINIKDDGKLDASSITRDYWALLYWLEGLNKNYPPIINKGKGLSLRIINDKRQKDGVIRLAEEVLIKIEAIETLGVKREDLHTFQVFHLRNLGL